MDYSLLIGIHFTKKEEEEIKQMEEFEKLDREKKKGKNKKVNIQTQVCLFELFGFCFIYLFFLFGFLHNMKVIFKFILKLVYFICFIIIILF